MKDGLEEKEETRGSERGRGRKDEWMKSNEKGRSESNGERRRKKGIALRRRRKYGTAMEEGKDRSIKA